MKPLPPTLRVWIVSAACAGLPFAAPRAQVTSRLLAPAADAAIYGDAGTVANGSGDHLFAGFTHHSEARRSLVRFDLAGALPAGAGIVAAELTMTIDRTFYPAALPVALHRVTGSWSEGASHPFGNEGGGAPALSGDTTWFHRTLPAPAWTAPGGDFAAIASAVCITPPQLVPVSWSSSGLVADVRGWLAAPGANHGWLLRTDESIGGAVRRFASRSNPAVGDRPMLRVDYVLPGTWGVLAAGCGASPPTVGFAGTFSPGTTVGVLAQGTATNTFAAVFASLDTAVPAALLFPGCAVALDPASTVLLGAGPLDAAGQFTPTFAIPAAPSFAGTLIAAQALLDTPAAPHLQLSSAAVLVLP